MAKSIEGRPHLEFDIDPEAGKYEKFKRICKECKKEFIINVPKSWFGERGKIKEHNLPPGITLEQATRGLNENKEFICNFCKDKERTEQAIAQTKAELEKYNKRKE